jgi:hypothetical protein
MTFRLSEDMERLYLIDEDGNDLWCLPVLDAEPMVPDRLIPAYLAVLAEVEDGETAALAYMAEADRIWRNR